MIRKDPQFNLRIPEDLKQWLEQQAQSNCRSQTSEAIFILRAEKLRREQEEA